MKNLKSFNDNCIDIHSKIVDSKRDFELKVRLKSVSLEIKEEFDKYETSFKTNKLELVKVNKAFDLFKGDLISLYNYQSSIIKAVRENIRSLQVKTIITTCQNCTIDTVNTLDHILPKSLFPQFVVNPLNLFPCCSRCNSYKLDANFDGEKVFLNLYLDELPEKQYLFISVFLDKGDELDFRFYLDNINGIDEKLFKLITCHYTNLKLFERMRLKSIEYFSEFDTLIKSNLKRLTYDEVKDELMINIADNMKAYGYNHWKYILEKSLLESPIFRKKIFNSINL